MVEVKPRYNPMYTKEPVLCPIDGSKVVENSYHTDYHEYEYFRVECDKCGANYAPSATYPENRKDLVEQARMHAENLAKDLSFEKLQIENMQLVVNRLEELLNSAGKNGLLEDRSKHKL